MKSKWILALLSMAAAVALMTGCAAGAMGVGPTASPMTTDEPMAAATMEPSMSPEMSAEPMIGVTAQPSIAPQADMTPADAGRLAEDISEAVERISEVKEAETVISGSRALVAVRFEEQYSAGLDDRMKKQITDAARRVDDRIDEVQITDDDTIYGQIKDLGGRIGKVTGLDELADDFGNLWDRITGRSM